MGAACASSLYEGMSYILLPLPRKRREIRKINQHLKKVAVELDISTDISSIWSRHSFATEMKKKKVSPYIIQEAFGHKDIKTTENYMSSLVEDDLRNIQKSL